MAIHDVEKVSEITEPRAFYEKVIGQFNKYEAFDAVIRELKARTHALGASVYPSKRTKTEELPKTAVPGTTFGKRPASPTLGGNIGFSFHAKKPGQGAANPPAAQSKSSGFGTVSLASLDLAKPTNKTETKSTAESSASPGRVSLGALDLAEPAASPSKGFGK